MEGPKRIYLVLEEGEYDPETTTWCEDRITDIDIEYVRADQVKELVKAANALIKSAAGAYNEKRTNVSKHKFKALRQALAAMEAEGEGGAK